MGPVISVFVMVLVISILAGLTFLFVSQLKDQVVETTATTSGSVGLEEGWINSSGYTLDEADAIGFRNLAIVAVYNTTDDVLIAAGNYTVTDAGVITNATAAVWTGVQINYTYTYVGEDTAYQAVNDTEGAGATVVGYLPLIFLALIFGAILTLVLKIILPYINLGKSMDGF